MRSRWHLALGGFLVAAVWLGAGSAHASSGDWNNRWSSSKNYPSEKTNYYKPDNRQQPVYEYKQTNYEPKTNYEPRHDTINKHNTYQPKVDYKPKQYDSKPVYSSKPVYKSSDYGQNKLSYQPKQNNYEYKDTRSNRGNYTDHQTYQPKRITYEPRYQKSSFYEPVHANYAVYQPFSHKQTYSNSRSDCRGSEYKTSNRPNKQFYQPVSYRYDNKNCYDFNRCDSVFPSKYNGGSRNRQTYLPV